jgi:alkylation response protein AidB-like acyl-CoA dehydrogenase
MTNLRAVSQRAANSSGAEGSVRKVVQSALTQEVTTAAVNVVGSAAVAASDDAGLGSSRAVLGSRCLTIAGGTSEIQKTIIAERLLGLPKEP